MHFKIAFSCLCFTKLLTWVYGETQNLKCTKSVFLGQSQSNLALESGENCGGGVEWLVFFFFFLVVGENVLVLFDFLFYYTKI